MRLELCWRSTKGPAAPATSTCEPGGSRQLAGSVDSHEARGGCSSRSNRRDHRVSVARRCGGLDLGDALTVRDVTLDRVERRRSGVLHSTMCGVSGTAGNWGPHHVSTCGRCALGKQLRSTEVNLSE